MKASSSQQTVSAGGLVIALIFCLPLASSASPAVLFEIQKLTPADGAVGDFFGWAVDLSGDTMVVGARNDSNGYGTWAGAAYVFERDATGWAQAAKLIHPAGRPRDQFGEAVAVSEATIVVGGEIHTFGGPGPVTPVIYEKLSGAWVDTTTIAAGGYDVIGSSVAVSGATVAVSAWKSTDSIGRVLVYERVAGTWIPTATLVASGAMAGDGLRLGAISGDRILAGSPGDDDSGASSGSAYLFEKVGGVWTETAKLTAADASPGAFFGAAGDLDGDTLVVGAFGAAAAYVFERVGGVWSEVAKLTALDAAAGDGFASSVSLSGNLVIVGAPRDDDAGLDTGSAYLFERAGGGWTEVAKLLASDSAARDNLGFAAAVSGNVAAATAHRDDDNGGNSGSVYVFERQTPEEAIESLAGTVDDLVAAGKLDSGTGNALNSKLDAALAQLAAGKEIPAVNQLLSFANQAQALARSGRLEEAQSLVDAAVAIVDQLLAGG